MTTTGYLYCQYHLEASQDGELGDGDTKFNPNKYQARLKLSAENFNCLIENVDFIIKPDGQINYIWTINKIINWFKKNIKVSNLNWRIEKHLKTCISYPNAGF